MKINKDAALRLKMAREKAGHNSAQAFVDMHGLSEVTYRSHENGTRNITLRAARKYAKLLDISHYWILDGDASLQRVQLNDAEIALTDVIKSVFQILLHNNLTTSDSLSRTLRFQLEKYKEKDLPKAVDVVNELDRYVKGELKESENDIMRRLLQAPALKETSKLMQED